MIKFKYMHEATCDVCGEIVISYELLQIDFKKKLRQHGWKIGKQDICPYCQQEPKQETLFDN